MTHATTLVWLRNDLRIDDHLALHQAAARGPVQAVYIDCPEQWAAHHEGPVKQDFRRAAVDAVAADLAALGIPLHRLTCPDFHTVPQQLLELCQAQGIQAVYAHSETPLNERRRDAAVAEQLQQHQIAWHDCGADRLVASPVLSQSETPFKVFTPFYKRWLQLLENQVTAPLPPPPAQGPALPLAPSQPNLGRFRSDLWPVTADSIHEKLDHFCAHKRAHYAQWRDFPAKPATSVLSPYLALGMLGPRRLVAAIQHQVADGDWRTDAWLRELAWRDFYQQLLLYFPWISQGYAFKRETDALIWNHNPAGLSAWQNGQTGFPIIDAAMRQMQQTGWMHNRLRMLTASFLSKLLFLDWRLGEQFFMQSLIDADFAANNGGWQWSASVGVDAAPYFRIFNPITQSQRFDPDGSFIQRFVPELAQLPAPAIHNPSPIERQACGYPAPIIDYPAARLHAIAAFKQLANP